MHGTRTGLAGRKRAIVAAAVSLAVLAAPAAAQAVVPAVGTPGGLNVYRSGEGLTTLNAYWLSVPGVDHYTVTLFDGRTDRATVVPPTTTNISLPAPDPCAPYRVRVAAVDANGVTASTSPVRVGTLAPGGIPSLQTARSNSGGTGSMTWTTPTNPGQGGVSYEVKVKKLSTGQIIYDDVVSGNSAQVTGLENDSMYAAKVRAANSYGSCYTATSLFRNQRPSPPRAFTVVRDATVSSQVDLSWDLPEWVGYGPLSQWTLYYRSPAMRNAVQMEIGPAQRSVRLELDPTKKWTFQIRALNGGWKGSMSKELVLLKDNDPGTPEVDPDVQITEMGSQFRVRFTGPVGPTGTYTRMRTEVRPTMGSGFSDEHVMSNEAGEMVFGDVPCGIYTVTVTGEGPGVVKEFARTILNRCDIGALTAGDWNQVTGQADIAGNAVDMRFGGESRVLSGTGRSSQNAIFTTDATLNSGWGYGIWQRARNTSNGISGYSLQYDPGYANTNESFGKALLLRLWNNGNECNAHLARVKWPTSLAVNAPHHVVMVTEGDMMYASIDGIKVFDIASLSDVVQSSGCDMPLPSGTEVGYRSWNSSSSVLFQRTTLN